MYLNFCPKTIEYLNEYLIPDISNLIISILLPENTKKDLWIEKYWIKTGLVEPNIIIAEYGKEMEYYLCCKQGLDTVIEIYEQKGCKDILSKAIAGIKINRIEWVKDFFRRKKIEYSNIDFYQRFKDCTLQEIIFYRDFIKNHTTFLIVKNIIKYKNTHLLKLIK